MGAIGCIFIYGHSQMVNYNDRFVNHAKCYLGMTQGKDLRPLDGMMALDM